MEMKVNALPAPTWNWLHMNDTTLTQVPSIQEESPAQWNLPEGVGLQRMPTWSVRTKTGMGRDYETWMSQSGVPVQKLEMQESIQVPIRAKYVFPTGATASAVEIHVGENAEVTLYMDLQSQKEMGLGALEIRYQLERGAKLTLVQVQHVGQDFCLYNNIGGQEAEHAKFHLIQVILSGSKSYYGCYAGLQGKRAEMQVGLAYLLDRAATLDMNYHGDHYGEKSISKMDISGVLREQARKLFRGTIDFHRGCAGANGAEMEDVLLMDDSVRNQTIPLILCDEEDVSGTHGASIGRLDAQMIFYLQSRGMSEAEIYEMMAQAKIEVVINQIQDIKIREEVRGFLTKS